MAIRKPLVIINGQIQELPAGDIVSYTEPVVIGFNNNVVYQTEENLVPLFVTTTDGDIVVSGI